MMPTIFYKLIDVFRNTSAKWDALSPSKDTAIDFAHQYINPEPQKTNADGSYSLEYCLAHSGETINNRYRHNSTTEIDKEIAKMVATHRTKKALVVYRGVCDAVFQQMLENAEHIKGVDFLEKAFLQTSLVKGQEIHSQYRLRIYIPEDTQAAYLGNVNDEQHYYEVVIQHGTQLKIVSMDETYINCIIIN